MVVERGCQSPSKIFPDLIRSRVTVRHSFGGIACGLPAQFNLTQTGSSLLALLHFQLPGRRFVCVAVGKAAL